MRCNILYFEKDLQARELARIVAKTRGDRVVALKELPNPIPDELHAKLDRFHFAVCTFGPKDDKESYRPLQTLMDRLPLAIFTTGDSANTAGTLRSIGVKIPSEHIFDKSSSTFAKLCAEMEKSLRLAVTHPAQEIKPATPKRDTAAP